MVDKLVLMRHGKAKPLAEGQQDFDRELSEQGIRALKATLAQALAPLESPDAPVRLWSSGAPRALQTAKLLAKALKSLGIALKGNIEVQDFLWTQNDEAFLQALEEVEGGYVFAVGHNPFIESIAEQLSGARLPFATGALACFSLEQPKTLANEPDESQRARLLWFSQGPISQWWKTLVTIEDTLRGGANAIQTRLDAFLEDPQDIETMHKLRVSIRTLRSLIAFVKPWQDTSQNAEMQDLLKSIVAHTSRQRELDVFAEQAKESTASSPELVRFCSDKANDERNNVLAVLLSKATMKDLERVHALAHGIKWKRRIKDKGLPPSIVRQHFDEMVSDFEDDIANLSLADVELTHTVRKRAKRARYAAENYKSILGLDAVDIAKGMTSHQDNLGAICDARVNIDLINSFLEDDIDEPIAWDLSLLKAQNETFLYSTLRTESMRIEQEPPEALSE